MKSSIFNLSYAKKLDEQSMISNYGVDAFDFSPRGNILQYFATNSLGIPLGKSELYTRSQYEHWRDKLVEGYFEPGLRFSGFVESREKFRPALVELLGAKDTSEVAILNDQSVTYFLVFRWLLEKQLMEGRNVVIYQGEYSFPSDKSIIEKTIELVSKNTGKDIKLLKVPYLQNQIDYDGLKRLIFKHGNSLALLAFGDGGISWKTGELTDFQLISEKASKVGAKTLFNLAHAFVSTKLELSNWGVTAAVSCSYKFGCGGPGGPTFLYLDGEEDTDDVVTGWFGFENLAETLHGEEPILKNGAQRFEMSNPPVIGWMPAFAAIEYFTSFGLREVQIQRESLRQYFFELFDEINTTFGDFLEFIVSRDLISMEFVFTTELALALHEFLNKNGMVCDIRGENIRVGIHPYFNSHQSIFHFFETVKVFFQTK